MQDLIIYNDIEVIVQADGKVYQDTKDNFLLDYGKKVSYESIDYNRDTKHSYLNSEAFKEYPNELCEDILNSIDTLVTNKEKREYVAPTLHELKQAKLSELKTTRDTLETEPIEYNGNRYDYDEKARDRINAAIIALDVQGEGAKISWTTADNEDAVVTAADLRAIVAAVAVRSNLLHIAYRKAKAQVEATGSAEEVDVVTLEL